ncbi:MULTISPECIES: ribonuclease PH [Okeania]|uniref:Ribonuclease PH n=1 Tax=Okeania hirsuta TaxID=1458930 RepID=A0A3N6QZA6_9CYAN|nr:MULTISPECIES: ribonuclease PH [Okeania]NET17378.1 ribonuclease PH [Okeania sp. SIO1H6]NEP73112.1 ribonuclease PH [Okeania sp. SIO2G5]NEP94000.1 ribonuclease PH [Okeania sp. SIO2F5]NEQ92791.1 ribonuclease PH [Okeania sp. SIO2G4]NES79720.1 ribonuclease PH [Okeania sp. SIO1H4]
MSWQRPDGRQPEQLRPVSFELDYTKFATSSVLTKCGETKVLCTVTIQPGVPKFLADTGQGWLTAEYRMLPGATPQRQQREFMKLSGRTQEIQRLIGRSLRASLDMNLLGERTIIVDADVLQADAGTRTTSITGGFVAVANAINKLMQQGELERSPILHQVAAVSVGLLEGKEFLDLNYTEDVAAEIDFNVVMNDKPALIEVQGTAETGSFSRTQLNQILDLAEAGIQELFVAQRQAISNSVV